MCLARFAQSPSLRERAEPSHEVVTFKLATSASCCFQHQQRRQVAHELSSWSRGAIPPSWPIGRPVDFAVLDAGSPLGFVNPVGALALPKRLSPLPTTSQAAHDSGRWRSTVLGERDRPSSTLRFRRRALFRREVVPVNPGCLRASLGSIKPAGNARQRWPTVSRSGRPAPWPRCEIPRPA